MHLCVCVCYEMTLLYLAAHRQGLCAVQVIFAVFVLCCAGVVHVGALCCAGYICCFCAVLCRCCACALFFWHVFLLLLEKNTRTSCKCMQVKTACMTATRDIKKHINDSNWKHMHNSTDDNCFQNCFSAALAFQQNLLFSSTCKNIALVLAKVQRWPMKCQGLSLAMYFSQSNQFCIHSSCWKARVAEKHSGVSQCWKVLGTCWEAGLVFLSVDWVPQVPWFHNQCILNMNDQTGTLQPLPLKKSKLET